MEFLTSFKFNKLRWCGLQQNNSTVGVMPKICGQNQLRIQGIGFVPLRTKFFSILWGFFFPSENMQNIVLAPPSFPYDGHHPIENRKFALGNALVWEGGGGRWLNDVEQTTEDLLYLMCIASQNFTPPKYRDIMSHCNIQAVNSWVHWCVTFASRRTSL